MKPIKLTDRQLDSMLGIVVTHHCDECGQETGNDFCPEHPNATVSSIASKPELTHVEKTLLGALK